MRQQKTHFYKQNLLGDSPNKKKLKNILGKLDTIINNNNRRKRFDWEISSIEFLKCV